MRKRNSTQFGLLLGLFLFILAVSGTFLNPVQAQSKHPEGSVIRGERPPIDIATVPAEAMEQGIIRIKFNKTLENLLDNGLITNNPDGSVRFGVSGIDQLNQQFGVFEVKKTFDAALQNTKYTERHRLWGFHLWYDLIVPAGTDIRSMVMAYSAKNELELSEPVYKKRLIGADINPLHSPAPASGDAGLSYVPNDTRYNEQWHYHNTGQQSGTADADIDLPEAWDITRGNTNVVVAVIDGGIDYIHPDLAANMWPGIGYNFVTGTAVISSHPHGTHVAGTVAANTNNAVGVSGVAGGDGSGNGVRLMSCQVFTNTSNGGFEDAPLWAADNGAAISQNSWGYTSVGVFDQAVLDAIDYFNTNGGGAVMSGGITIFAAGNSDSQGLWYPGCYSGCFSVAATGNQDLKAWYSNYDTWVDISAPGGETDVVEARGVLSTLPGNTYGFYQGTSMACPHVSGVAALILSIAPNALTPQNIKDILTSTADNIYPLNPGYAGMLGSGRLNAYQALLETQTYLTPTANFSASPTTICVGGSTTFTNLSSGGPTSWNWSFPGGSPSSFVGQNPPVVTYTAVGTYNVSLTVSDGITTDTETKTSFITVKNLIADFSGAPLSIFEGNSVTFTDNSSCGPTTWAWLFPGGTPSSFNGQNPPAITYSASGVYDVTLTASKPGATDIKTKTAYVTVAPPVFNMGNGSVTTCAGSFFDSGGPSDNYTNNQNFTFTFYPGTPGAMIRAVFSAFEIESGYDFLSIYDGINTSAPIIGTYTGTTSPGTVTASNGSGALTFHFTSDFIVVDPGWVAAISCFGSDPPVDYCIPEYSSGTGSGDYISLVQLGSINNATGASSSPYYTYYSSLSTDLSPGTEYTITLSAGTFDSENNVSVWIDFNQNGVFDTGEKLGNVELLAAPATGTITFTVPANALPGVTRMRVREVWAQSDMDPCSSYSFGETEDYNVNILPIGYCIPAYTEGTSDGDYISLVQLGDINNATGASASPFYTYYSGLSTDLNAGSDYTITLSPGTYTSGNDISVWIDYNYNGVFDANERLGDVNIPPTPATGSITFTVPANILPGTTRMRVREAYFGGSMDPCATYDFGETEDYNVQIINSNNLLNLTALLEGLYAGSGTMNQANNELGPQFGPGIADQITVELHNAGNYDIIEFSDPDVFLSTSGFAVVSIPSGFSGSYYLTVKHRNSIETTSALPVDFSSNPVSYNFSTSADQAYSIVGYSRPAQKPLNDGFFAIYGGNASIDRIIDGSDMGLVDNASATPPLAGYNNEDINGDGIVDGTDIGIIDNNSSTPPVQFIAP